MLANDFKQRCVRKALLVVANRCRRIDPSEYRRLTGCALRPSFYAKPRVGLN